MTSDPIRPTPNLSPPSKSDLFALSLSSRISNPPPPSDPRVSLRSWPHLSTPTTTQDEDEDAQTLRQVRENEGRFKRLERLREVFESIPDPPPQGLVSTTKELPLLVDHEVLPEEGNSVVKAAEVLEEEKDQWEVERNRYMKELWTKCGAEVAGSTSSTTTSPSITTNPIPSSSSSKLSTSIPSTSTPAKPSSSNPNPNCLRWSSFETYADTQESLLFSIFTSISQNNHHELKLTPTELKEAFRKAGVEVEDRVVEGFVRDVDRDGDGLVGWEEWRDFLILLPRKPSVKEIVHFYRSQTRSTRPSMSRLTQDGDVVIGRGKTSFNRFLSSTKSSSPSSSTSSSASSNFPSLAIREQERKRILAECDLHRRESGAVECRWAREEQDRRKMRKRKGGGGGEGGTIVGKGLDFEGSGVVLVEEKEEDQGKENKGVKSEGMEKKKVRNQVKMVEKEESSVQSTPSSSSTPIPPTRTLSTTSTNSTAGGTKMQASGPIPVESSGGDIEEEEEEEEHGMFSGAGKFLLAGGTAGAVSRTATAPFDRLKVYLITSPSSPLPPTPKPPTDPSAKPTKTPRRNAGSLAKAVKAVYSQGGMRSFWTGNMLNVIKIFPESAIKFLSYESAKRVFAQHWDCVPDQTLISNTSRFISGGIGGVVSQLSIYPIESLKTRVMSSTGGAKSGNALILQTFLDMYRKGGLTFFFRGLPAGLIGVFPYAAIDMSTFEGIKISYTKWAGEEPGIAGSLCFGAVSGGVGATSVYPLNLVRTRLQAQGTPAHPQVYTGIKDAAIKCYQREGWRGFYKGLTPTLVKVVPAVAISYAVYDQSKKFLFGKEDDHSILTSNDSNEEA